jgi:hypothetical protein
MKTQRILLCAGLVILASPAVAQQDTARGDPNETRAGILQGNLVKTVFYNFGEFGDWLNRPDLSFDWPQGSGHLYIAGTAFIVQARTVTKTGNVIHPLETNYYEYTRYNVATGVTYGWWPLPDYAGRYQSAPAQSNNPSTWPAHWPDKPSDWDGEWNGYLGKGVKAGLTETYYVMDDNGDRGYISSFNPDSSDSTRGGLGLKVRVRAMEWIAPQAQDILFVSFEISNVGTTSYDSTFVAQYVDYSIGGIDNSANNFASYLSSAQLFVAQCSNPVGLPGNWSPVGVLGITDLATPDSKGLTGVRAFAVHTYDLNNDERNWTVISSPTVELDNTNGINAACLLSSGPFILAPGDEKQALFAYIFAYDTISLKAKTDFARRFYESGFDNRVLGVGYRIPRSPDAFALDQNYPNPFNPSTSITYELPRASQVSLTVYDLLGRQVSVLVNERRDAGVHEVKFDGSNLASGVYFYRLQAGDFVQSKRLLILK